MKEIAVTAVISTAVGAVLGLFLRTIWNALLHIMKGIRCPYVGDYHSYHYSSEGEEDLTTTEWHIRERIPGRVLVKAKMKYKEKEFRYKGHLKVGVGHLYFIMNGEHGETAYFVFKEPVERAIHCIPGVYSGLSTKSRPCAGKVLITDTPKKVEDVKEELGDDTKVRINWPAHPRIA